MAGQASPAPSAPDDSGGTDDSGPVDPWMALAAILLAGAAALAFTRARALVRRRRAAEDDADLATLRRVLTRTGGPLPPRLTLRQLELRLEHTAGPAAARYAQMLRERRFGPRGGRAPDGAARRDLRRALSRGKGLRARLVALIALPPASFRRS